MMIEIGRPFVCRGKGVQTVFLVASYAWTKVIVGK
jgi:hypothetical protein